MDRVSQIVTFCAVFGAACLGAHAQTRSSYLDPNPLTHVNGAGFDPTPVEIPAVQKNERRAITNMDLLTIRDLHGVQISPDGRYVAFVLGQAVYETNSYRSGLFVVGTAPGSVPVSLGTAGPPRWSEIGEWLPEPPQWSPDSQYVTYCLRKNGRWQIWRWSRKGGRPVQLTHNPHDVQIFEWTPDGRAIKFAVRKAPDPKQIEDVEQHGVLYDGSFWIWQKKPVVQEVLEHRVEEEDWVLDVATGEERRLHPDDPKGLEQWRGRFKKRLVELNQELGGDDSSAHLSPDGNVVAYPVYVHDPSGSLDATYPLHVMNLDGGPSINLTPTAHGVSEISWSADGGRIFFKEFAGDGHSPKLFSVNAGGGVPAEIKLMDSRWHDEYSLDDDHKRVACVAETNTTPAQITVADVGTGEVRTLVDPNPEFANLELTPAQRIEWINKYGEHDHAYLIMPLNSRPDKMYPLIVTTYRSGDYFLRGGVGDEYPIQVFAAQGFVVLAFDIGLLPNHKPGDFEMAKRRWTSPLASFESALKIVGEMGIVDSSRRGLTGLSVGAEITGFVMTHSDLFQAAIVSGLGWPDPSFYYMGGNVWQTIFAADGLGYPEGDSSRHWREVSSALNAEHVRAPILSNSAETEYIADLQTYTALEHFGKPVELFVYPNEAHVKNQPKHRYEIYERNVDWFKFWFLRKEDSSPAKTEQYARWHELRKLQEQSDAKSREQPRN
jgi:dipeptidyl aminopeptidase/acylaminoacyl peptidase